MEKRTYDYTTDEDRDLDGVVYNIESQIGEYETKKVDTAVSIAICSLAIIMGGVGYALGKDLSSIENGFLGNVAGIGLYGVVRILNYRAYLNKEIESLSEARNKVLCIRKGIY